MHVPQNRRYCIFNACTPRILLFFFFSIIAVPSNVKNWSSFCCPAYINIPLSTMAYWGEMGSAFYIKSNTNKLCMLVIIYVAYYYDTHIISECVLVVCCEYVCFMLLLTGIVLCSRLQFDFVMVSSMIRTHTHSYRLLTYGTKATLITSRAISVAYW